MTYASGRGAGTVGDQVYLRRQLQVLCSIPIDKLASSVQACGIDPSGKTRGQLIDAIGPAKALKLGCACQGKSIGWIGLSVRQLGDAGDDFTQGGSGDDSVLVQPLNPDIIPNIPTPEVTPGGPAPDVPDTPKMSGDGFPPSPPFRPGNWQIDANGAILPKYFIAEGDTWSGLARLYLGGPARWKELWQPNSDVFPDPDVLSANVLVTMPQEAANAAQALLNAGQVPASPASPGAPGSVPGAPQPTPQSTPGAPLGSGLTTLQKGLLITGAVVIVGGGIAVAASR